MNEPTLGEVYRLVQKIDDTLNGNGREGVVTKVIRHETWLKLVGGAITVIGTALATHIIQVGRLGP